MGLADRLTVTASRLLTQYGEPVACVRSGAPGAYDPTTLETTLNAQLEYTGVGLPTEFSQLYLDNNNIQQGDTLLYFSSATEPKIGDSFKFRNETFVAINVERIRAQDKDVMYKIQVRI